MQPCIAKQEKKKVVLFLTITDSKAAICLSEWKKKQAALQREAAKHASGEIIHTDHWHSSDCDSDSESKSDAVIPDCDVRVSLVCYYFFVKVFELM